VIGPIFFEFIQRKGDDEGFGEGNFRALFESIEEGGHHETIRDQ
jgi:4-hydroxyphenylpyruvate dioxygenase